MDGVLLGGWGGGVLASSCLRGGVRESGGVKGVRRGAGGVSEVRVGGEVKVGPD